MCSRVARRAVTLMSSPCSRQSPPSQAVSRPILNPASPPIAPSSRCGTRCGSICRPARTSASERLAAADRKLDAITPRARQAFLLMAVEEFSTAEAAQVLDTDEASVKALVDQAASEIAEQVATNVLIIEDEPMIAIDLADLVTGLGHTFARPPAPTRRRLPPSASTSRVWSSPTFSLPTAAPGSTPSTRSSAASTCR